MKRTLLSLPIDLLLAISDFLPYGPLARLIRSCRYLHLRLASYFYRRTVLDGSSPDFLYSAALSGQASVVRSLLAHGASASRPDRYKRTALQRAATHGHASVVVHLLQSAGPDLSVDEPCERGGITPLLRIAAYSVSHGLSRGHLDTARLLLENGANPNAVDRRSRTPLHFIFPAHPNTPEFVGLLCKHGADVNARCDRGRSPLHCIARYGEKAARLVEILVRAGADPNAVDYDGHAPLHIACGATGDDFCSAGCADEDDDEEGEGGHERFVAFASALLQHGADVNIVSTMGVGLTALVRAACERNFQIATWLLRHGADLERRDKDGRTPVMVVAGLDNINIAPAAVWYFVKQGAALHKRDRAGRSILDIARSNEVKAVISDAIKMDQAGGCCDYNSRPVSFDRYFDRSE